MSQQIVLSGIVGREHGQILHQFLTREHPGAVGIAAAFVSVEGVRRLSQILVQSGGPRCRLIAGIDNVITHPEALYEAQNLGWKIRLGQANQGIFHPKLVVAGQKFGRDGLLRGLSVVYVGSSNLTAGGFQLNVECGFIAKGEECSPSAAEAFRALWDSSTPATATQLRRYARKFSDRARRRKASELAELGIYESQLVLSTASGLRTRKPSLATVGAGFARTAWTGLQSFTGEYRFQVEFPRTAGQVIDQMISSHVGVREQLEVYCRDDDITRPMKYGFYRDNGMFRLNIPNEVPGVLWARKHRDGIAVVEKGSLVGAPLSLQILKPGAEESEIVGRSVALGTWDKTPTRVYGWY